MADTDEPKVPQGISCIRCNFELLTATLAGETLVFCPNSHCPRCGLLTVIYMQPKEETDSLN